MAMSHLTGHDAVSHAGSWRGVLGVNQKMVQTEYSKWLHTRDLCNPIEPKYMQAGFQCFWLEQLLEASGRVLKWHC